MALACDIVVASEAASFSEIFVHVGLIPDGGPISSCRGSSAWPKPKS
jgi:enoyl-CoA hydratase/carnithine racemase